LAEAFRAELDRGMALADYAAAKSLFDQAVGGNVTDNCRDLMDKSPHGLVRDPTRRSGE
jgi:hypothetical protein